MSGFSLMLKPSQYLMSSPWNFVPGVRRQHFFFISSRFHAFFFMEAASVLGLSVGMVLLASS